MSKNNIIGLDKLLKDFKNFDKDVARIAGGEILKVVFEMDSYLKKSISQGARSGRVYNSSRSSSVKHQASAIGELPKTDTGELVSGFNINESKKNQGEIEYINSAPYAKDLEYKPPSKGGRPFMRPALDKFDIKFKQAGVRALKEAIKNV